MIKLKKINKEKVAPIPVPQIDSSKIKGYNIIPALYCNIALIARKKSGKTSAVFKILKDCADKDTKIYIFSSTAYNDDNMIYMQKYFKKKKYQIEIYTEMVEGKANHLQDILKELETHEDIDEEEENKEEYICLFSDLDECKKKKKKKKKKKIAPEIIFVFDDISESLKNPSIAKLVKQHRHYKSKVIISSQEVIDIRPETRKQIDFYLLFGNHPENRLEMVHKDASIPISFELFKTLYDDATRKKYNFLFIDVPNCKFRKNFNEEYEIQ